AEDYDFAFRSRQKGYRVLMDPKLVIDYFSRPTFFALAKQYYRYGYWTCQLIRKHRRIPALRKLMPFGLVTTTIAMTLIRAEYGALLLALYAIVLFELDPVWWTQETGIREMSIKEVQACRERIDHTHLSFVPRPFVSCVR